MGQVFADVSGNTVTIRVIIDPLDVVLTGSDRWEIVISSKTDHGLGSTGSPDYPFYVDHFLGNGNITTNRILIPDQYVAELALFGLGVVDYSMFQIKSSVGCTDLGSKCDISGMQCYYNVQSCRWDCQPCSSGSVCQMQAGLAKCVSGVGILSSIVIPSTATVAVGNKITITPECHFSDGTIKQCPNIGDGLGTGYGPNGIIDDVISGSSLIITGISVGTVELYFYGSSTLFSNTCTITVTSPTIGVNIKVLVVSQDDLTKPLMRTAGVSGTGTGTFTIKEGSIVVASGTMTNGWGLVDINNISAGNHTYCAIPSSVNACDTFTVVSLPVKTWSCSDNCKGAHIIGEYSSQQECIAGCKTPPTCTNPKYKWIGGICASDDCDGTGTFTDSTCAGGGGGIGVGILGSITIDKTISVQVGKTVTLTAVCKDKNGNVMTCPSLIWQSDNESIVKVSAGVITGIGVGTANILVKDSATSQIVSNVGIATTVTVKAGINLSDWLQTETCIDSQKKYCTKNWIFGAGIGIGLILLTRNKE